MPRTLALQSGLVVVALLAVAGCGGSAAATNPPGTQRPTSAPSTAPSPSPRPSPSTAPPASSSVATVPTVTVAATEREAPLTRTWEATAVPSGATLCMTSPAVDGRGRPWVAGCQANAFWVFGPDGRFAEAWGKGGSEPGQFDFTYPASQDYIGSVAFAADGSFFTVDAGNLRVQHFDAKRKLLASWGSFGTGPGQFTKPTDIVVTSDGNVAVADGSRGDVQVFSPDGTFVRAFGDGRLGQPDHFAWLGTDADGNVYGAEQNHTVVKFGPDGAPVLRIDCISLSGDVTDSAAGPDGHLYVTFTSDSGEHLRGFAEFDAKGTLLHLWPGIGEEVLVVDDGAAVLVTDYVNRPLTKYALPKA